MIVIWLLVALNAVAYLIFSVYFNLKAVPLY